MTIQSSGPINLSDFNTELLKSPTTTINMDAVDFRNLVNNPAALSHGTTIAMSMGYGAYRRFVFSQTISVNTANYNLRAAAVAAGWDQVTVLVATVTVNVGITLGGSTVSNVGFDTGTNFPTGTLLTLINNGNIVGKAGDGNGGNGGPALTAQHPLTIANNGIIGGGGGGGGYGSANVLDHIAGGGWWWRVVTYLMAGGGGAGAGWAGVGGTTVGARAMMTVYYYAINGYSSTPTVPGGGGHGDYGNSGGPNYYQRGGPGGSGGNLGQNGNSGGFGIWAGEDIGWGYITTPAPAWGSPFGSDTFLVQAQNQPSGGGIAGTCTTSGSNALITWQIVGNRYGSLL